jgi:hypothetical protein
VVAATGLDGDRQARCGDAAPDKAVKQAVRKVAKRAG